MTPLIISSESNNQNDVGSWKSNNNKSLVRNNNSGIKMGKISSDLSYSDDDHEEYEEEEGSYFSGRDVSKKFSKEVTKRHQGLHHHTAHHPRRSLCHSIFVMIQIIALVSNLSMLATQVIPLFLCQLSLVDSVIRYSI